MAEKSESVLTVVVAGAANLAIAAAKAVAGVLSGSAAMLSEAAHSVADTVTELMLFVALRRGAKPADPRHPFGYGKESFFWAFIAAVFTFVGGGGFSIYHGVQTIREGERPGDFVVSYVVLAVAFVIEGISFTRAVHQLRGEAGRLDTSPLRFLRMTSDTAVKAVILEDAAALVGIVLAALGLLLTEFTGDSVWDGLASVAIGVLLVVVAVTLARANVSLLVGQAMPPRLQRMVTDELAALPTVDRVGQVFTMMVGPGEVMVAAKIDFTDRRSAADVEAAAEEAERRLVERFPGVRYVFLDPTPGPRHPGTAPGDVSRSDR